MDMRIDQLPAVLTSFAYRQEYFPELEGMTASVREHHPDWWLVTGKGPLPGYEHPTLRVESPVGEFHWQLPVFFQLDGTENDWLRIVWMKAWWVAKVWHLCGNQKGSGINRVVWLDADARVNGPLDILLEPEKEIVAGPWGGAEGTPDDHILSGLLVFQGSSGGIVESIVERWSAKCLSYICNPPPPSSIWQYGEGDQEVLTTLLKDESEDRFTLCKLDYNKYFGEPDYTTGTSRPGALVDQWMMNEKMRFPQNRDRDWPPPEQARHKLFYKKNDQGPV
jgi:hypothetical protein